MAKVVKVGKAVLAASMFVSSIVFADGFYLGGQVGVERTKLDRVISATLATTPQKQSADSSSSHFNGGIYGGYKMQVHDTMTLAFEADVFFLGSKSFKERKEMHPGGTGDPLTTIGKDKVSYMVGLSALGGYVFDDMFEVYGRLGLSMASIEFQSLVSTTPGGLAITKKKKVNPIGLVAGVGLQMSLGSLSESLENVSARVDYRYIHFQKKDIKFDHTVINNLEYKQSKHLIMLGVDYKF